MLYLLILLQAGDIITTTIGLRQKGVKESNPLAAWLFRYLEPVPTMIFLKCVGSIPFILLLRWYPSWWPAVALYCLSLCWVVQHNIRVIRG